MSHSPWPAVFWALEAELPVHLIGEPGVGKTSIIRQWAAETARHVEIVLGSLRADPSEVVGLQVLTGEETRFSRPLWLRRTLQAVEGGRKAVVLFDELSTVPPALQKALMAIVLERIVGETQVPPGVSFAAASNPPECAAEGFELAPPLANRFIHIQVSLPFEAWSDYMLGLGGLTPATARKACVAGRPVVGAKALVASFLRAKPHLRHQLPRQESERGGPWPSSRSWEMAAKALEGLACPECAAVLAAGSVGPAALEFLAWLRQQDLPDPEELLARPASFTLPDRSDVAYSTIVAVAQAAVNNLTPDRYVAAWEIAEKVFDAGFRDLTVLMLRILYPQREKVKGHVNVAKTIQRLMQKLEPLVAKMKE